jgi:molecular chaperone DnaJ
LRAGAAEGMPKDAVAGKNLKIRIPITVECHHCDGTGAKPGTNPKECSTCYGHGHGQVLLQQGFFSIQ